MAKVKNVGYAYDGRKITVKWDFDKKYKSLDHYAVKWQYWNPSVSRWSDWSSVSKVKAKTAGPITLGDGYSVARVSIKPVQKDKRGNGVKKWTGKAVTKDTKNIGIKKAVPENPSTPKVEITGTTLKAYVENYKTAGATIKFEIVKNDVTLVATKSGDVVYSKATIDYPVEPGCYYRVRCRAIKGGVYSESYSDWSENVPTAPGAVPGTPECIAMAVDEEEGNVTRVSIKWNKAPCVGDDDEKDSYEIEFAKKKEYFDRSPDDVSSTESKNLDERVAYITISEAGTWFFRVRGVNASGKGGWSEIAEVTVGLKPEAPTTWSYSTAIATGDIAVLNWTHNSADGSKQRKAQIQITIVPEENQQTEPIDLEPINIDGETMFYNFGENGETEDLQDGSKIQWKVRTQGVFAEYSDWSIVRTINVYREPTVSISLELVDIIDPRDLERETQEEYEARAEEQSRITNGIGKITSYPLKGTILAGPDTQSILSLDFTISATEDYFTEDDTGMTHYVAKGDPVFSRHIDNAETNEISFELDPGDVALESSMDYKISVTVAMSSGLEASESVIFYVDYDDDLLDPDAEIYVDPELYTAAIRPFCSDEFNAEIRSGYTMRVYRRNYDGTFTRIVLDEANPEEIEPGQAISVTDPHPALDYARYRIVARSTTTGQIFYYDAPGEPINEKSIVINWDDEWAELENTQDEAIEDIPSGYYGSLLVLPNNVDVSESNTQDVALVEYIGRDHPVSYYGTQKGYSASWKCEIPKTDTDKLSAVRRLARYAGDVYVREPSGAGYWASIKVSYNIDHNKPNIPITFDITRVEGGM